MLTSADTSMRMPTYGSSRSMSTPIPVTNIRMGTKEQANELLLNNANKRENGFPLCSSYFVNLYRMKVVVLVAHLFPSFRQASAATILCSNDLRSFAHFLFLRPSIRPSTPLYPPVRSTMSSSHQIKGVTKESTSCLFRMASQALTRVVPVGSPISKSGSSFASGSCEREAFLILLFR